MVPGILGERLEFPLGGEWGEGYNFEEMEGMRKWEKSKYHVDLWERNGGSIYESELTRFNSTGYYWHAWNNLPLVLHNSVHAMMILMRGGLGDLLEG